MITSLRWFLMELGSGINWKNLVNRGVHFRDFLLQLGVQPRQHFWLRAGHGDDLLELLWKFFQPLGDVRSSEALEHRLLNFLVYVGSALDLLGGFLHIVLQLLHLLAEHVAKISEWIAHRTLNPTSDGSRGVATCVSGCTGAACTGCETAEVVAM